jgi:glycosyltransferase involved in cell wall biosynthesis
MSKRAERQPRRHRQPTIAVCVIARDEEAFIASCLDSARAYVDEMVVVDTGSADRTVEIARARGARVEYFEWCDDFAAARNAAIEAATADWILMLDADEALDPESGPLLRHYAGQLPSSALAYAVVIQNRRRGGTFEETIRHAVTRFFPRRPTLRYVGAIHEDLVDLADLSNMQVHTAIDIRVVHYGYDPAVYAERAKDVRNMRLLERAHAREPHNARLLYYLGQQSYVGKRYPEAIGWFERFAERASGAPRFWLVDAYQMWLEILARSRDTDALARVAYRAEAEGALSAVSRETLASYQLERGHPGLALPHLLAALSPEAPTGMITPEGAGGWRTRLLLAQVHRVLNAPESALREMDRAFSEAPAGKRLEIATHAAELALSRQQRAEALTWLARAAEAAPDDLEVHTQLLHLKLRAVRGVPSSATDAGAFAELDASLARQDWQTGYELGMRLPQGKADALARVLYLASELRQRGAAEAALDLLARAVDTYPPSTALYWPLIQVLKDLQRFDDALAAAEVLSHLSRDEEVLLKAA